MKTRKTRAFTLTQVIALLPLIATATAMGTHLYSRTMRVQRLELEYMNENNAIRHLVKRLQEDALLANGVELHDNEVGQTLRLTRPGEDIILETRGDRITRTLRIDDTVISSYPRTLKQARIDFTLETVRADSKLIWIRMTRHSENTEDTIPQWFFAAAARVGRGD
ncbi:MAG: hypothetical protein GXY44_04015 [Phycisphaerales bacterium]|nr:hypothetical protein [Phycisphaerales bacterium]